MIFLDLTSLILKPLQPKAQNFPLYSTYQNVLSWAKGQSCICQVLGIELIQREQLAVSNLETVQHLLRRMYKFCLTTELLPSRVCADLVNYVSHYVTIVL
jgi:hypothetical protein